MKLLLYSLQISIIIAHGFGGNRNLEFGVFGQDEAKEGDKVSNILKCGTQLNKTLKFTTADYNEIYGEIEKIYNALDDKCTDKSCPKADLPGCWSRFAAHDFFDFNSVVNQYRAVDALTGGSDGCVKLTDLDNGGLATCIAKYGMPELYGKYCSKINIPDFIVLAAESLMAIASTCPKLTKRAFQYNYRYGRNWCGGEKGGEIHVLNKMGAYGWGGSPNNENPSIEHAPPLLWHYKVTLPLFFQQNSANRLGGWPYNEDPQALQCNRAGKEIGLQWEDMTMGTALLGAHSIGRAEAASGGYQGFWNSPEASKKFDNSYFRNLLFNGYKAETMTEEVGNSSDKETFKEAKHQWSRVDKKKTGNHKELMLNTDVVLVHNYEILAKSSTCCAFFPKETLDDWGFGNYSSSYCGSKEQCCNDASATDCNTVPLVKTDLKGYDASWTEDVTVYQNTIPNKADRSATKDMKAVRGGLGLDSVKEFAKNETTWLHWFHKAWYLATTQGGTDLTRLEQGVKVGKNKKVYHECFSWGCQQFKQNNIPDDWKGVKNQVTYFNSFRTEWRGTYFSGCDDKFKAIQASLQCSGKSEQNKDTDEVTVNSQDKTEDETQVTDAVTTNQRIGSNVNFNNHSNENSNRILFNFVFILMNGI